jgi:hypothetical protein
MTGSSNAYTVKGTTYFLEQGREQRDGAITGTVWKMTTSSVNDDGIEVKHCEKSGSFRIDHDGTVKRYPAGLKNIVEKKG